MKVRVWDLPTRLFHWSTVLCFGGLIITGEVAGDAMVWHFRLGYALLTLLLFRVLWGFVGGYWSRFSSFVKSPAGIVRYLKGDAGAGAILGHNPLGALSVLGMLGLLLLQIAAGLMSDDEVFVSGPLVGKVPAAWVQNATFFHTEIGKVALIVLALLHVAAILWYRFKKNNNLVPAMIHGDKDAPVEAVASQDNGPSRLAALLLLVLSGMAVAGLLWWAQSASAGAV